MRDYRQYQHQRSSRRLQRGADGRLRPIEPSVGQPSAATHGAKHTKKIELDLRLPRFAFPKVVITGKWRIAILSLILVIGVTGYILLNEQAANPARKGIATGVLQAEERPETPTYTTMVPTGKTIEELGGWARVSPPDKDPVFAYADAIAGVQINVSQQPLPATFRTNPADHAAQLAKQFGTSQRILTNDALLYVGTSVQGPQSAIAIKGDLLILIKSKQRISEGHWATYLESLQEHRL